MTLRLALPASVALALLLTPVLAASPSPQGHELFQVDRLTFPQGDARFGEDLDREGDTLAVGIPASEGGFAGQEVGQVQIFSNVSGSWVKTQDLFPVHAYNVGHFGEALDLDGDTLVVGAPGESVPGVQGTGYVYIFRRVGGAFTLEQELLSPTLESFEGFGREVSLDGDVLLVKGSTEFVFERMGSTWSLRSTVGPAFSTSMTASFVSGDQILIERSGL